MKIALVSSLYGVAGGGAGLAVQQLAEGLQQAGHVVVVITTGNVRATISEMQAGIKIITFRPASLYRVHEKDTRPIWQKFIWQLIDIYNPFTGYRLKEILRQENPDIIHIHKMRGLSGAVWTAAAHVAPGGVVQTCHDFESMSPMGTLEGYIGKLAREGKWPLNWYQALRGYLARGVKVVTAPSTFALNLLIQSRLFSRARPYVVPNSHGMTLADLAAIQPQPAADSEAVRLMYLGRLEPEKGVHELCSAFIAIAPRFPTARLIVAGWGSLEADLRAAFEGHSQINFAGRVFGDEKARLLSTADVVVIPSTVSESFGMVAVEAFAYGKPVIASNIGGLAELVIPGETGWLIRPGAADDLARAIEKAIAPSAARRQMSTVCFETAKRFTIGTLLQKYETIYADLLKNRASKNTNKSNY